MDKGVILKVYGRVQGVGFRFYTQKRALELKLNGFVRNKPNGSVYIEAEGPTKDIDEFIDWCQQGPEWARVDKLEKQYSNPVGHEGFVIK